MQSVSKTRPDGQGRSLKALAPWEKGRYGD